MTLTDEPRCTVCLELKSDCRRLWATDHIFGWPQYRSTDPEKVTEALSYARQAVGDARADGPREPEQREHKRSPKVDELRAAMTSPPPEDEPTTDQPQVAAEEER